MLAKIIIVITKMGECFVISSERGLDQKTAIMTEFSEGETVSIIKPIESNGDKIFAVGLSNGEVRMKYHH